MNTEHVFVFVFVFVSVFVLTNQQSTLCFGSAAGEWVRLQQCCAAGEAG